MLGKTVKWYLLHIDFEKLISRETYDLFTSEILNEKVFNFFKNKPLTDVYKFFNQEIIAQYFYLVNLPLTNSDKRSLRYIVCVKQFNSVDSVYVSDCLKGDSEVCLDNAYSVSYLSVPDMLNLIVPDNEAGNIFRILHSIFYESYYTWSGSQIRKLKDN